MSTSSAPTSAAAAANEFLQLGQVEPGFPALTQMKLQKLLFYAHAWHLATRGAPLFDEDFEAWAWGPVLRDIYFETREYGRSPVTRPLTRLAVDKDTPVLQARFETPYVSDAATKHFLKQVWDTHKQFSAIQLSNSTHAAGEPWTIIKERFGSLDNKPTIPNDLIAEVFKKKLANARPAA